MRSSKHTISSSTTTLLARLVSSYADQRPRRPLLVLLPLSHRLHALRVALQAARSDSGSALAGCHASSTALADDTACALLLRLSKQLLVVMFTAKQTQTHDSQIKRESRDSDH
jgi:hypothetical protein